MHPFPPDPWARCPPFLPLAQIALGRYLPYQQVTSTGPNQYQRGMETVALSQDWQCTLCSQRLEG